MTLKNRAEDLMRLFWKLLKRSTRLWRSELKILDVALTLITATTLSFVTGERDAEFSGGLSLQDFMFRVSTGGPRGAAL